MSDRVDTHRERSVSPGLRLAAPVSKTMPDYSVPPSLYEIVRRYGLAPLQRGGLDFTQTSDGNIATTVDGDLKRGDDQQNALSRLAIHWRFNEPSLRANFEDVVGGFAREKALNAEMNSLAARIREQDAVERFHAINDEIGVLSFSRDASAGTIMVVLANLLHRLRVDLGIPNPKPETRTPAEWFNATPAFAGHSLGAVLDAAAANFRHHDEWARTDPPTDLQMRSIPVLAAVLGETIAADGSRHPLRGNECPEVLLAITDGQYENLNEAFFAFVRDLAKV